MTYVLYHILFVMSSSIGRLSPAYARASYEPMPLAMVHDVWAGCPLAAHDTTRVHPLPLGCSLGRKAWDKAG